jgi:hypothetical protein
MVIRDGPESSEDMVMGFAWTGRVWSICPWVTDGLNTILDRTVSGVNLISGFCILFYLFSLSFS